MATKIGVTARIDWEQIQQVPGFVVDRLTAVEMRIAVVYRGVEVICESLDDAQELVLHALKEARAEKLGVPTLPPERVGYATDEEVSSAAARVMERHGASLAKLSD